MTSQKAGGSVFTPYASSFSYTASGGISQMKLGNLLWETAKFNTRMQVTELGLGHSATNAGLWKVGYEYGELNTDGTVNSAKNTGNIARQTLTIPGTNFVQGYKYDSLYRLTEAKETTGSNQNWIQNWDYDRYGNRTTFSQNVNSVVQSTTPTIDANTNRFVEAGTNFDYDLNGNLISDGEGRQFTFNGDNKQTEVRDSNGILVGQYFFDGEGKRIKKVTASETTVFVYSSGKLIAEYSTQLSQNPTISYTTTGHLGSPRIITDQFGQVRSRRDFMPFGEDLFNGIGARSASLNYGSSTDDIKQKFTGYLKDTETSLDFAEARMYENRHGRFTAVDPLLASGMSDVPQTFNRYIYTRNAPLVMIDPSGKIPGEYYRRDGTYIGSDGIDDKRVYIAEETGRDKKHIYVNVIEEITLEKVRPAVADQASQAEALFRSSPSNFGSISQRSLFYQYFQASPFSNNTNWAGAAADVTFDIFPLTSFHARFFGYSNDELSDFAKTGNRMIFDDVFGKLGGIGRGGALSKVDAFAWDARTLAAEQTLVQPLYEALSERSFNLLSDNAKGNFWVSPLVNRRPFPADSDLRSVGDRWAYGMKRAGYNVTADQMPMPDLSYRNGEVYNRLNPGRPVGPVVVRFSF